MARASMFFYCLAVLRGVEAALENPAGSMIFTYLSEHIGPNLSLDRRADPILDVLLCLSCPFL